MFNCFGQDISEINKSLELPPKLEFEKEIRIYKDYSIKEKMEIFRMYDRGNNDWIACIYSYSKKFKSATKITEIVFSKEEKENLKIKDPTLIWLNILLCNVEYLPDLKDIDYKLNVSSIELENGEYSISKRKNKSLDGENYWVFIRNGKNKNHFNFDNPESYLKSYPKVDELISYNKILSVIKKAFNL